MVYVIIPVKNEKNNIGKVLSRIPKKYNVIVVDDGSTDNTSAVVKSFGFKTIILEKNQGKANACKVGVDYINKTNPKSELIIFMDGDAQHDPKDIPKIVKKLNKNDLVIGYRDLKAMSIQRQLSNKFARKLINYITKKDFKDVLCGFRGIKKTKFQLLNIERSGYEFEAEMIIKAIKNKFKIDNVPVRTIKCTKGMPFLKSMGLGFYLISEVIKRVV